MKKKKRETVDIVIKRYVALHYKIFKIAYIHLKRRRFERNLEL